MVVGGGIIGLAVAWRAAAAGPDGRRRRPRARPGRHLGGGRDAGPGGRGPLRRGGPGRASTWRPSGPGPASPRDLEAAVGHARPLPGRRDPAGGRRPLRPGRHRPGAGLPPGHGPRRPTGSVPGPAGRPSRCSPPAISGGVDLPDDHQVDNRAVVAALVAACRAAGVAMRGRPGRPGRGRRRPGHGGVTLDGGGPLGGRRRGAGRREPVGRRSTACPTAARPPVRPVRGVTVRLRGRRRRRPGCAARCGPWSTGASCYLVPRDDGGLVVGATVEERGFDLDVPLGGVADLLEDARRVVPALDEYAVVEVTPGLRPGLARQRADRRGHAGRRAGGGHRPLPQRHPAGPAHRRRGGGACSTAGRRSGPGARSVRRLPPRPLRRGAGRGAVTGTTVNGEASDWRPGTTVADLVAPWCPSPRGGRGRQRRGGARAAPGTATTVAPGDAVEIVTAAAGG